MHGLTVVSDLGYQAIHDNCSQFSYFKKIILLETVDSTNKFAMESCANGDIKSGTLIIANNQTAGKGRLNNQWESGEGTDILVSFIISPTCKQSSVYRLTCPFSLSIHNALKHYVPTQFKLSLKWPNDILIDGKKCGGILSSFEPVSGNVIIGLGININSNYDDYSDRCSMIEFTNAAFDRSEILLEIIQQVELNIDDITKAEVNVSNWNNVAAFIGEPVSVLENGKFVRGEFKGIHSTGSAIIGTKDGDVLVRNGVGLTTDSSRNNGGI